MQGGLWRRSEAEGLEYGFAVKPLFQGRDGQAVMLGFFPWYQNTRVAAATNRGYGEGKAAFFAEAVADIYQ